MLFALTHPGQAGIYHGIAGTQTALGNKLVFDDIRKGRRKWSWHMRSSKALVLLYAIHLIKRTENGS